MRDDHAVEKLNAKFGVPGRVTFAGDGSLPRAVIATPAAEAEVYLHGAHVTQYRPRDGAAVLFTSGKSHFSHGRPIRGGVPVVFPWFGPRAADPQAPMHGIARVMAWEVESTRAVDDASAEIVLALRSDEETCSSWPHDFLLRYRVTVGPRLSLALEVTNRAAEPFTFEEALHTYLCVGDVRETEIEGLRGARYLDKNRNMEQFRDAGERVRIEGREDRIYLNTRGRCVVHDRGNNRRIVVDREGSEATIVWNPWQGHTLADLGADEWPRFVCVETANVKEHAVTLDPGKTHAMSATIHAEKV